MSRKHRNPSIAYFLIHVNIKKGEREMKKLIGLIIILVLLFAISCEMGKEGETFLAYSWASKPLYFYDENPSTPSLVTNGEYFRTNEGRYYFEYIAWDNSGWWAYYTITAKPGELFSDGAPTYFEITLYSSGPSLYTWSTPRSLDTSREDGKGYEKITINGSTIELEWGPREQASESAGEEL